MPSIPIYLKNDVYWRLSREADRLDIGVGKLCSKILEMYCEYLEERGKGAKWPENTE